MNSLASLADDTNDKILNDSLIQFIDQFESAMTNCQSVRQTKKEISAVNEQLSNTIDSLDKTVADLIIEGRMKGNDTTLLERLTLPITEFMQIQLRLHSLFSNLGDVFFMKELTKKHQLILTTLNDFTLETRVLSGYGKEIEVYGNQINRLLQVLVDLTVQNNQVTEGFISGKQKLQIVQSTLLKHLEAAESLLHVSSQQRAKSLKKNFNWIPFAAFLLIGLPLAIVLFSAQLARSAYTSLKKTWEMRDKSKEKLKKAHKNLEIRVIERTGDLAEANKILKDKIAERIDIEKALKKREFQLTETQKVAKIGSWDLDLITPKLDWSNETFKLFDKDPEDFIPSFDEFARIVHPNDLETMQTRFNNALESDENPYHVEVRIINDSGREWVMEAFGKVTRDDSGKALSIFGTAQDVTEKSLVEALRESEEYLKSIYEAAENIAFVVTDLGG
ncbi:MAG: PAS domain-containing protein, partial [Desulfobacteraceae bacterium]|nr:PAS domain-containing protein [Desulfobacteraceae bacterium]